MVLNTLCADFPQSLELRVEIRNGVVGVVLAEAHGEREEFGTIGSVS